MNKTILASRTTEDLGKEAASSADAVELYVLEGPDKGATFRLSDGMCIVGSGKGCDTVLTDLAVSRQHVAIERRADGIRLRDLGSKNGVVYLNAKVSEAALPVGATFRLGRTLLALRSIERVKLTSERDELFGLIAKSPKMREVVAILERLGPADCSVLIEGETGTGKELCARALHQLSLRSQKPLVVLSCSAIPEDLFERELFGHVKGAFTGAHETTAGLVASAEGGTLLFDLVEELPLEVQAKLLRLLDSQTYRPVGSAKTLNANIRVVATTRTGLTAELKEGQFREDLYHRLAATSFRVPPLRERREDIPALVEQLSHEVLRMPVPLSAATVAAFYADPWPGNVRELKNAISQVAALGRRIESETTGDSPRADYHAARDRVMQRFEREYLTALLQHSEDNVAAAARDCGLSRMQLYRLLRKHGLH